MKKLFFLLLCFSLPIWATECPPNKPLVIIAGDVGECISCKDGFLDVSEADCAKCPKYRYFDGKKCQFRHSPDPEKPLIRRGTVCYGPWGGCRDTVTFLPCSQKEAVETTPENCALCPNRDYKDGFCVAKVNCSEGEYANLSGNCVTCDADDKWQVATKEECQKCSQRLYLEEKYQCILKSCPKGKIAISNNGCESCNKMHFILPLVEDDTSCPNRMIEKYGDSYFSILKQCPNNSVRDKNGSCITCEEMGHFKTNISQDLCIACGHVYDQGLCLSKDLHKNIIPPRYSEMAQKIKLKSDGIGSSNRLHTPP